MTITLAELQAPDAEVRMVRGGGPGEKLYDVWVHSIGDWLATLPPMPTRYRARAQEAARFVNERALLAKLGADK